jgi:hypothetical protein
MSRRHRRSRSPCLLRGRSRSNTLHKHNNYKKENQSDWELLIRSVDSLSLTYISALKGVYPRILNLNDKKRQWIPSIYTTYLSSKIDPNQVGNTWSHDSIFFGDIILVFHPDILRDLPFVICNADMHGRCNDPDITEEEQNKLTLYRSKGKLNQRPDMTFLSDWINLFLDPINLDPTTLFQIQQNILHHRWKRLNKLLNWIMRQKPTSVKKSLPFSHELMFDLIPEKYIVHIFTLNSKNKRSIQTYFPKVDITVIRPPQSRETYYYRDYIVPLLSTIYSTLKPIRKQRAK